MIATASPEQADIIKKSFEHNGLEPVIVIADGIHFVCRDYTEATRLMSLRG